MSKFITYCRVSTDKQGVSGLGMDAQRNAVELHAMRAGGEIVAAYIEVESGKNSARPQMLAAIAHCKLVGAVLLIAKLDRLARNVAFISSLMDSGVEFVAADMPTANRLTIHILAAVAEHEARAISDRTKLALAQAKARGTKLGGFRARAAITPEKRAASLTARQAAATIRASAILPMVSLIKSTGVTSLRGIAVALNTHNVPAPRGGQWISAQVSRIVKAGE